jgi:hypothetical protein
MKSRKPAEKRYRLTFRDGNAKMGQCEVTASSMTSAGSENNDHSDLVKVERIHKTGVVLGGFYKE